MSGRTGPVRLLDDEEIAELRRLWQQRADTIEHLADQYGISVRTAWRYLRAPNRREGRVGRAIDRWAYTYVLRLRQQERDALVDAVCHALDLADRRAG